MKVLALDTSTMWGIIGISDDGVPLAEIGIKSYSPYSKILMEGIDFLLRQVGLKIDDIEGVGVGIGPGSFTGLRVGISTIIGIAYAKGLLVAPIPSLEAIAMNLTPTDNLICPIIDAKKKEIFSGLFRYKNEEKLYRIEEERSWKPSELAEKIKDKVLFTGSGITKYGQFFKETLNEKAAFVSKRFWFPRGSILAIMAERMIQLGEGVKPHLIKPIYGRASDAELSLNGNKE